MKKLFGMRESRRSLILASAFAPVCFGVLIGSVSSPKLQSSIRSDVTIINKTTTLEVVAQEPTDHNLVIRLKNVSSKDLNGYAALVNNARITVDISSGDRVIPPGQTDDLAIPTNLSVRELTILAAMFADGSIEGDQATAAELKEWRLGLKQQLIRALSVLEATLESPDVNAANALDRLESQISGLPLESVTAKTHSASGSQDAKNTLATEIQILRERRQRNGALKQRERLLDLKGRLERRIAKL